MVNYYSALSLKLIKTISLLIISAGILISCASTEESDSTAKSEASSTQAQGSQNRVSSRRNRLGVAGQFPIKVSNQSGETLAGVLVVSTLLIDDSSKYIFNKPNKTLSEPGLSHLLRLNRSWLDVLVHKPDPRLRIVGISDEQGEVTDTLDPITLSKALRNKPKTPVVYAFLKSGYAPTLTSWSLDDIVTGKEKTAAVNKQEDAANSELELMISGNANVLAKNQSLKYVQSLGVRPARLNQVEAKTPLASAADIVRQQLSVTKTKKREQLCRMRYWLGKSLLNELGNAYTNYNPDSKKLAELQEQLRFVKNKCSSVHHLQALRLVDERNLYSMKRQWYYRNKIPTTKWPKEMNWSQFKRDWIVEAEFLDKRNGKTLWPVFHRSVSQMYYQGFWMQQYEKLTQFKKDHPQIYGRSDERDRASSAFMNASKYKRMAKMSLDKVRKEQTRASALKWFLLSSDMGNCVADREIGDMYENGILVDVDYKQALYWYRTGLFKDCQLPQVLADLQTRILRVIKKAEESKQLTETLELPKTGNSTFKETGKPGTKEASKSSAPAAPASANP